MLHTKISTTASATGLRASRTRPRKTEKMKRKPPPRSSRQKLRKLWKGSREKLLSEAGSRLQTSGPSSRPRWMLSPPMPWIEQRLWRNLARSWTSATPSRPSSLRILMVPSSSRRSLQILRSSGKSTEMLSREPRERRRPTRRQGLFSSISLRLRCRRMKAEQVWYLVCSCRAEVIKLNV